MLKKSEGEKNKRKNSKKHQQEIRVGGAKDGSISNMNIGDKLKILVDITKNDIVKKEFKNSPFDKKTDGTYYDSDKITKYENKEDSVLQTIKFILMCIYLGTDESYYYLVNHFKSISDSYIIDLKVFPKEKLYKIVDTYTHYYEHKNYANKLFNKLQLKLTSYNTDGKPVVINNKLSNFDNFIYKFIENFYKFRIYCQTDDSVGDINKLYVPFKYYNLTKLQDKENKIKNYIDSSGNSLNNNFRIVEKPDIKTIIVDIKKYTTEFDNIIVIEQKEGKSLKYPEKFTATMIIDFLNSLYTTPIINDEYDKYIKGKILEYNTYFFVELFIKEKKRIDGSIETKGTYDSTLTKLLKYLRRAAIGNYRDKEEFMKIVDKAISNVYNISVLNLQHVQQLQKVKFGQSYTLTPADNNKIIELYSKIEAYVEISIIGRDLLCDDTDNLLGIQSIIFYSFMIRNENFSKDDIIIDRLKSISKIEESTVRISQKKGIKDCDKIIDNIVSNKEFLLGFSLYTTYSTEILNNINKDQQYNKFKNIADKIKEVLDPNYKNIIKNYNKSIDLYFAKYKMIDTSVNIIEQRKEFEYIFDDMGL